MLLQIKRDKGGLFVTEVTDDPGDRQAPERGDDSPEVGDETKRDLEHGGIG